MRYIRLKTGERVKVDDSDYEILRGHKWFLAGRYAARTSDGKHLYMHREIIKAPKGRDVDHINRDRFDNRRQNLRLVSKRGNLLNMNTHKDNRSGFKGVSYAPRQRGQKKWRARLCGRVIGYFTTPQEASHAYQKANAELAKVS